MLHTKAKNDRVLVGLLSFIALILLVFSDLFYISTGYGSVSIFLLLCAPITFLWVIFSRKILLNGIALISYSFFTLLGLYTAAGVVIYARPTLAIQFLTLVASPLLFLNIGFFVNKRILVFSILLSLFFAFIFSISQFTYFGSGYAGPFSILEKMTALVIKSQDDFFVENIYGRSSGIFNSPNILGFFGGIVFWLLMFFEKELSRSQLYVARILAISCLILSISRGSIFAFILSIVGFLLARRKTLKLRLNINLLGIFAGGVLGFILIVAYYVNNASSQQMDRFFELFYVIGGDSNSSQNFSARIDAWNSIANKISLMPFGTILPPQLIINESPDNQFVYYFAQGGYILVIFSIIFYCALLFMVTRVEHERRPVFIAVLIFAIVNSLSITVMNSFCFMMFWLFLGLSSRSNFKMIKPS